jgi:hypothetical protein
MKPQEAVPESPTSAPSETRGYGLVMIFYLVTGALGILYFVFLLTSLWLLDRGSLAAESLMYFLVFGFPGLIIGFLAYAWPIGIILLIRYRLVWRVAVPAALLLAFGVSTLLSKALLLRAPVSDAALVLYVLAACLVGIEWLVRRK